MLDMFDFVVVEVGPNLADREGANIFESCKGCEKAFFWIFWFNTKVALEQEKIGDVVLESRRRREEVEVWDGANVAKAEGFEFCEFADGIKRRKGRQGRRKVVSVRGVVVSGFNRQRF